MMKLSLMKKFFDTVDPQWQSPLADQILSLWFHDPGSCYLIRASSNFIFIFKVGGKDQILRFVHASQRTLALIQSELNFINHLSDRGIQAAQPVKSLTGRLIERVDAPLGPYYAVVFEAVPGQNIELEDMSTQQIVEWGATMARMHNAQNGFLDDIRPTWQMQLDWAESILPHENSLALRALQFMRRRLSDLPVTTMNYGLIHYDLEADNLNWHNGVPGIYDFDDCAHDWFAADVAYALRDTFEDRASRVDLNDSTLQTFVRGYRSIRAFPDEELENLPLHLFKSNLLKYVEIQQIVEEKEEPGEPEWVGGLRQKLVHMVDVYHEEIALFIQ